MRKMIFAALATLACIFSSCSNQSKEQPLAGCPDLSTFTMLAEDGETVLTGVKQPQTGHVIVPPEYYQAITSDGKVITCTSSEQDITVYTVKGEKIGNFEMFTPWQDKYYLGVIYINKTYYFPAVNEIISTRASLHELELIFIKTDSGWDVRSYTGELKSKVPAESFWIIRDAKVPTNLLIGVEEGVSKGCTLYKPNGEVYKKLTRQQWNKLRKKLHEPTVKAESISVADVEGLEKI